MENLHNQVATVNTRMNVEPYREKDIWRVTAGYQWRSLKGVNRPLAR